MIRVNLLPIRQARRRSAGRTQLGVFAALIIAQILVLGVLWLVKSKELSSAEANAAKFKQSVAAAKKDVADASKLEERKTQLEKQLGVLSTLESSKSGPVRMMDEFQALLTPGEPRDDAERIARSAKKWDEAWDENRVWIYELNEAAGKFTVKGGAVDSNDVAEFLRRLISADHFDNVELDIVQSKEESSSRLRHVEFTVFGDLLYSPKPKPVTAKPAKVPPANKPQQKKGT